MAALKLPHHYPSVVAADRPWGFAAHRFALRHFRQLEGFLVRSGDAEDSDEVGLGKVGYHDAGEPVDRTQRTAGSSSGCSS
jgi:hypothetical protein